MIFEVSFGSNKTHAGVLEFVAEEGRIYLPNWMMSTLCCSEGDVVRIRTVTLPLGKFVKIQPQSVDFLDISDPKAVLEQAFRNFTTLTPGDVISISYNSFIYEILVMETKPNNRGISIVDTDLEVDFAAPKGYVEPSRPSATSSLKEHLVPDKKDFAAFNGSGQKLNGKLNTLEQSDVKVSSVPAALHLPHGRLFFGFPVVPFGNPTDSPKETPFSGAGKSLRNTM